MTPTTLAAFGASLWLGGAITAAAFGMRHHAAPTMDVVEQTPSFAQIYERIPPPPPLASETFVSLPSMTVFGTAPAQAKKTVREPRCTAWRPLQQGSNMVQMCE